MFFVTGMGINQIFSTTLVGLMSINRFQSVASLTAELALQPLLKLIDLLGT